MVLSSKRQGEWGRAGPEGSRRCRPCFHRPRNFRLLRDSRQNRQIRQSPQLVRNCYNPTMDAILLAAGLGTRLRPHTLVTPKPLLLVRGRPILDWILAALPPAVERVIVVTHYLSDQIEKHLRSQNHGREWVTVPQGDPRGT